jgi:hypothetical protein
MTTSPLNVFKKYLRYVLLQLYLLPLSEKEVLLLLPKQVRLKVVPTLLS